MEIKYIGYWYSRSTPQYPVPVADTASPEQVKAQLEILDRLAAQATERSYRGVSCCRICGKVNGSREYEIGQYRIPDGLRHYVEDHHVLVPDLL